MKRSSTTCSGFFLTKLVTKPLYLRVLRIAYINVYMV